MGMPKLREVFLFATAIALQSASNFFYKVAWREHVKGCPNHTNHKHSEQGAAEQPN